MSSKLIVEVEANAVMQLMNLFEKNWMDTF